MRAIFCLTTALALSTAASADPVVLYGTVGTAPVYVTVDRSDNTVTGYYLYMKVGKQIELRGKIDRSGIFTLDERLENNTHSGSFVGTAKNGHWSGTWKNGAGKNPLPFALDEVKSKLAEVSGHYKCALKWRDKAFDGIFNNDLDLTLDKGKLKRFAMSEGSTAVDGDEQSCQIDLSQLKPIATPLGIRFRAKSDSPNGPEHCTFRIVAAGDYLVVEPGSDEDGDSCKSTGDEMFCSPRGAWSPMVLNRTTQTCKNVH